MKVTVIPIVVGTLGMVPKGLEKRLEEVEIRGRIEIIQTTALLKLARILKRVLETCCHSNSSRHEPVRAGVKNSQGIIIIMVKKQKYCYLNVIIIYINNYKDFLLHTAKQ